MHNPGDKHFQFLKRLLRYLKGTLKRCLHFDFSKPAPRSGVYGYYDASHCDDFDTYRSTLGFIMFYEGCPISWKSKLHSFITLSTNNTEYCASAKNGREAMWLRKIGIFLGQTRAVSPIDLFSDNKGNIATNQNPVNHESNKHCNIADHYARELVQRGIITISFVPTTDMIADVFTQPLPPADFNKFVKMFMADGLI